jgi:hypothetical protein
VTKKLQHEDPAAYQPLRIAINQAKCLPKRISGLEVFNAFKFTFGEVPRRNEDGFCIYTSTQLEIIAQTSSLHCSKLLELEEWRQLVPLVGCASRMAAMNKLARLDIEGWLQRCSYRRGQLLLCKEDAEHLCYVKKSEYKSIPIRWSLPTVLGSADRPVAS